MVFQRNKELLIGVGRRDFELGSAPAFPVVRVEIDLEEWHTTLSLSHSELRDTQFQKEGGKKKVFKRFPRLQHYLSFTEHQENLEKHRIVLCVGTGELVGF